MVTTGARAATGGASNCATGSGWPGAQTGSKCSGWSVGAGKRSTPTSKPELKGWAACTTVLGRGAATEVPLKTSTAVPRGAPRSEPTTLAPTLRSKFEAGLRSLCLMVSNSFHAGRQRCAPSGMRLCTSSETRSTSRGTVNRTPPRMTAPRESEGTGWAWVKRMGVSWVLRKKKVD